MKKHVGPMEPPACETAARPEIRSLGAARIPSPLRARRFISEVAPGEADGPVPGVRFHVSRDVLPPSFSHCADAPFFFQEAGPRERIYFDPPKTKAAIVTCGGLCPGINDVIRAIVMEATHAYCASAVYGIRYGLRGFLPKADGKPDVVELTPESVADIHAFGGSLLASSRGPQDPGRIVDALERLNISILFMIGGDGTLKAARAVDEEVRARGLRISIIGVPKTIDNDIAFMGRSFGYDTAVEKAASAIRCAHAEAEAAHYGVGMVKVMGRESGFIAAGAALAQKEANFVLIPEDDFELDGPNGFLAALEERVSRRKHAVVVVAEGAGQRFCREDAECPDRQAEGRKSSKDASGNTKLSDFCGVLQRRVKEHFAAKGLPLTLKFIDPSYIIRSVPANANDRVFCGFLGRHAVHAGFAGKTGMVVASLHDHFIHLPLELATCQRRFINLDSPLWHAVLETTGQPPVMRGM